LVYCFFIPE